MEAEEPVQVQGTALPARFCNRDAGPRTVFASPNGTTMFNPSTAPR
jgi:hypothetical protein